MSRVDHVGRRWGTILLLLAMSATAQVPPDPIAFTGVTPRMWAEIDEQRRLNGDPNDCRVRVDAVPKSGPTLKPCNGNCINAALAKSRTVILRGGVYRPSQIIDLGDGGRLVGAEGETVLLDASGVTEGVRVRDRSVLANIRVLDAGDIGINFLGTHALVYRVSVGRTGQPPEPNESGAAFGVHWGASYNCLVSTVAFDSWNELGSSPVVANGGNADGYALKFGAHHNTLIDAHAYRNGDDGFDFWKGGVGYLYFSSAVDNGRTIGKQPGGDGAGFKLGVGDVQHHLYRVMARGNTGNGFDLNGNTVQPAIKKSSSSHNSKQDYAGIPAPPQ